MYCSNVMRMETILHFVLFFFLFASDSVKAFSFRGCPWRAFGSPSKDIGNFYRGIEVRHLVNSKIWSRKLNIFGALALAWLALGKDLLAAPLAVVKRQPLSTWVQSSKMHRVHFSDIPPTVFHFDGTKLLATVNKSASALVLPLSTPLLINEARIHWRPEAGHLKLASPEQELQKEGDDAWWRIGLILAGEAPTIPFFAPAWVKELRDVLILPSREMVYLIAGSKQEEGKKWENPYSASISCVSMRQVDEEQGWKQAAYRFSAAQTVVGFWLMADGDNTASEFSVSLDLGKSWVE